MKKGGLFAPLSVYRHTSPELKPSESFSLFMENMFM